MADDFRNLRDFKEDLFQSNENGAGVKRNITVGHSERVFFVITKKKQNSWVDDLDAREKLNQITRIYH
jgi:hypothetical protein